ncbi:calponin homology domain-containing protein [Catenaria anguillulae PL171]|uniref:Calponin homology domain-containing protein n=1 Tax=Catenaria anguillulae PL171 TaxID=765915 RepID=A0A1Y2HNV4_9FUNG|nr:calponin homology domain-containing protein [Catenaria anguillulae PL171]
MSRVEMLTWINQVTQLGLTKIEELGRGDALCQIFDSIYLDVPLKRVKFGAKHEFEYIQNFKVLQAVFDKHKIPNDIPVQRLVKLKFQDNIEFVQFVKKFWEQHYPGHAYDPVARRGGAGGASVSHAAPAAKSMGPRVKSTSSPSLARSGSAAGHYTGGGMAGAAPSANAEALQQAQNQIMMLESQVLRHSRRSRS